MTGVKSDSISEKTTERSVLRFFSPLIATMYTKDDWGNLEEYGEEVCVRGMAGKSRGSMELCNDAEGLPVSDFDLRQG